MKAGVYPGVPTSSELSDSVIDNISVGPEKQSLLIVGESMNVLDVCHTFGRFVKFRVRKKESAGQIAMWFEVMMASQR